MKNILIINTGGTFNKRYNPLKGELEVPNDSIALEAILDNFQNLNYEIKNIIHKDSLDIEDKDRQELAKLIKNSPNSKILIVHGTDTMDKTAQYLEKIILDKCVVLTGAMIPFSIKTMEANSNFSMALGYLLAEPQNAVFVSMHGLVQNHKKVFKNRVIGVFEPR
jgi:L-asparaginase